MTDTKAFQNKDKWCISKYHQINIYETTTNSLLYKDKLAPRFTSNIGVKQGDTLSTILFNLYINDLPEIFKFD